MEIKIKEENSTDKKDMEVSHEEDVTERTKCPYWKYEPSKDKFGDKVYFKKYHDLPVEPGSPDEKKWTLTRRNGRVFCCSLCWLCWLDMEKKKLVVVDTPDLS